MRLFYDGGCGLCRAAVRFAARRDRAGSLRFSPLGGPTFLRTVPRAARAALPDSLVVRTPEGRLLVRAAAVAHLLRHLGGAWGWLGVLLAGMPAPLGDGLYRLAAWLRPRGTACRSAAPPGDGRFEP